MHEQHMEGLGPSPRLGVAPEHNQCAPKTKRKRSREQGALERVETREERAVEDSGREPREEGRASSGEGISSTQLTVVLYSI